MTVFWTAMGRSDIRSSPRRDDFIVKSIIEDREFTVKFDPNRDLAAFERAWARRAAGDDSMVTQYLRTMQDLRLCADDPMRGPAPSEHMP